MNNDNIQQEKQQAPVVTFSNIPLDDTPPAIGFDAPPQEAADPEVTVADVQFKKGGKVYYFDPGSLSVSTGDEVIIDTARGPEYGFCAQGNHTIPGSQVVTPLRPVIRVATERDRQIRQEYKKREFEALSICQQKAAEHKLDMKLVSAEYSFDGSKILFYFTADGRVDFRDLVKDLAGIFRTRIELRQIGVRDEAKMLGGLGICGRPFCCKQFLSDFQPVSIKMAKTQSLSLNPTKISGTCGRLMCCLKYEQDAYESLIKSSPRSDSLVNTYDGVGTVVDSNLLKQTVKVQLESDPSSQKTYNNCEICVLRNGKARKNDPPIDTNIPPLPRPEKQQAEPETITLFDESRLSNYTPEDSARADERDERRHNQAQDSGESHSPRRYRNKSEKKTQSRADAKKARPRNDRQDAPKSQELAATAENKDAAKKTKPRKKRYYRGKKPQKPE